MPAVCPPPLPVLRGQRESLCGWPSPRFLGLSLPCTHRALSTTRWAAWPHWEDSEPFCRCGLGRHTPMARVIMHLSPCQSMMLLAIAPVSRSLSNCSPDLTSTLAKVSWVACYERTFSVSWCLPLQNGSGLSSVAPPSVFHLCSTVCAPPLPRLPWASHQPTAEAA